LALKIIAMLHNTLSWRMAIILKAYKVNLFVSSVLFVFWYHLPNFLDTPRRTWKIMPAYNHPPSSSVSLHVLVPRSLSVLSSTKII
jgi:hypothetical protein